MNSRAIKLMFSCMILALAVLACSDALAEDTATNGWRGDGSGRFPNARIVTKWSADENIIWSTDMPSSSNALPILVDGKLFVCSEPTTLICLNEKDGKILWSKSSDLKDAGAETKLPKTHRSNGYSSATPTSDGKGVYVVYGTGVAAAYELDGTRRWIKSIERPAGKWGHSASPVLAGGNLIISVVNIVALDPKTGEKVWEVKSSAVWGTPLVTQIGGEDIILAPNGEIIRAKDGKVLTKNKLAMEYNGVLVHGGVLYGFDMHTQAYAYRLPEKITDTFTLKKLWRVRVKADRYYASPVIHDGIMFGLTRKDVLTAVDIKAGKKLYEKNLEFSGKKDFCFPSLVIAGENLLATSENGTTVVIKPGKTYTEIARNKLEPFRSTPLPVGERMYIRGLKKMYCVGK